VASIQLAFGHDFIGADNGLDRNKMRQLVFADLKARERLEAIIHPLVHQEAQRQAAHLRESGQVCAVFDIPLLVESSYWRSHLDKILVIDCTPETQIQRVTQRNQLPGSAIQKMIQAQAHRDVRLKAADLVICNVGLTLDQLAQQVRAIQPDCGL